MTWTLNGEIHRDFDLPAIDCNNGKRYWYRHGKIHREGGLNVIYPDVVQNGTKMAKFIVKMGQQ